MKTLEEIEQDLKAVTDKLSVMDAIIKGANIGVPTVMAFHCNHSGLYFPSDYIKNWGRPYGVGLGPDPVSEVLDSDYDTAPPKVSEDTLDVETIMHPLVVTRVQIDLVTVPAIVYNANKAILAVDDPRMRERVKIIRPKQLENPKGKLRALQAQWQILSRGLTR